MREIDPRADGEVGDVDPILAIEDALRASRYDSIVLAIRTRPHRRRLSVAARVRRAFSLPVIDVLESISGRVRATGVDADLASDGLTSSKALLGGGRCNS